MCRLLLAIGKFDTKTILEVSGAMARGDTCPYPAPSKHHPHGFGLLWSDVNLPSGFDIFRSVSPLGMQPVDQLLADAGPSLKSAKVLAIHSRFATRAEDMGIEFTHPLKTGDLIQPWYFMHNGFTPFMYQRLGLPQSNFDTAEYFEVVQMMLEGSQLGKSLARTLEEMPSPTTSANMFLINRHNAHVFNWWPQSHTYSDYCQMHILKREHSTIISSDLLLQLAPANHWRSLPRGMLSTYNLTDLT